MLGIRGDTDTVRAFDVAGPDLVTLWAGQMIRDAPAVGTQTEPVGEALAQARELARVAAVEVHAENLPALIAHDLHEQPFVGHEQRRCVEWSQAIARGHFGQCAVVEIVEPEVRRRLVIILVERPARTIAPRLHAEEDHTATV